MPEPTRTNLPDPEHPTAALGPTAEGRVGPGCTPPGYELLAMIGSGGMGVVYRARELALTRDVAVKILQDRFVPESAAAARFLDEARITGQLQHPGIPPIHQVGTLPDGRPFLAMKLIKGRTLDEMLKERSNPAADRGRFLAVFEQVAQAVGYAHAHDVIHRDLKPANVMVGAFGEVQVMDWGLAKIIDNGQAQEVRPDADTLGTEIRLLREGDVTQAGSLLGTPAYMAPEQAIGAVAEINVRSDVFGLGGILCAILTGSPPYVGANAESTRHLAARAKLDDAFARLDASGAEPELIALAKKCLAVEVADRPGNAGEVADAVAALRADAERRARQAEMDRARAEVKAAEERKRRRVKRALALAVVGLFAVVGFAGWWIESVRAARRADQLAREAELKDRETERTTRQLAYERDVTGALDEVRLRLREGHDQADDPARWALTLGSAAFVLKRAENLLAAGEPTDALRGAVSDARAALDRDTRDRNLVVELNRIADSNEIRFFFPFPLSSVTSNQFAAAFRNHGIDLLSVPTDEAVAWLKAHRLRGRLTIAVRNWHRSLPTVGLAAVIDPRMMDALEASAAVTGSLGPVGLAGEPNQLLEKLLRRSATHTQLGNILNAVTDDPFARQWWAAVERRDMAKLKELVAGPDLRRMPAREMGSLAEGLNAFTGTDEQLVDEFLAIALERFPGEFWVHFRSALRWQFRDYSPGSSEAQESYRHLTAALASRPTSSVVRLALGVELIEHRDDERAGMRMLESAVEADPASPWPHLFIGMHAVEQSDWPLAFRAFKECIRIDPDTGFFMTSASAFFLLSGKVTKGPTDRELVNFFNELIELHPRHPGGYDLLANYYRQIGDHRSALAALRKARALQSPNYVGRPISASEIKEFEAQAAWEEKLPAVLRGEGKPADSEEVWQLAGYCATFEKRFALATRFVAEGIEVYSKLLDNWMRVAHFAGWAVQASAGHGADGTTTPLAVRERYRRLALGWLREAIKRTDKDNAAGLGFYLSSLRDFAPVREPQELAKLPPDERAAWEKLWAEVTPVIKSRKSKSKAREVAPLPREVKQP